MMKAMELIVKIVEAVADSNETKVKITSIRNRLTRCKKKVLDEVDTSQKETLIANTVNLRMEEEETCHERVKHTKDTELGDYH